MEPIVAEKMSREIAWVFKKLESDPVICEEVVRYLCIYVFNGTFEIDE